jgi:hypothetical protein
VEIASNGYSGMREMFSTALIVLMCMAGLILVVTCANVASLLIARASARQKEIAVRLAIGAGRGTLIRGLLVESRCCPRRVPHSVCFSRSLQAGPCLRCFPTMATL